MGRGDRKMYGNWGRQLRRFVLAIGVCAGALPWAAQAQPVAIPSQVTSLQSTADRMISLRHQYHMWQTPDGANHLLMNRGITATATALSMNTSMDGMAWSASALLPATDYTSTSDGFLLGDSTLYVAYSGKASDIRFAQLQYDPSQRSWTMVRNEVVFANAGTLAMVPSIAMDASGRVWVSFTSQDLATGNYSIKLMLRPSDVAAWTDTGFVFGAVDNVSNERSSRLIATPYGLGMIFTVHQNVYWTQRLNFWPTAQAWPRALVYVDQAPDTDPYGSHFSLVADAAANLHLVFVDGGHVVYSRLLANDQGWATRIMTDDINATYVQVLTSRDNLMVVTNSQTYLRVFQSTNTGDSFSNTHVLTHPLAGGKVVYDRPRVETPSHSTDPVPVLQQYVEGQIQKAMGFWVPVVSGSGPH